VGRITLQGIDRSEEGQADRPSGGREMSRGDEAIAAVVARSA